MPPGRLRAIPARPRSAALWSQTPTGSGTTWIFTGYLSKISAAWKEKVGTGKAVAWPTGVGGKGNEGVANYVKRIAGSIGYVEFAYALKNKIPHVLLQNRAGKHWSVFQGQCLLGPCCCVC